MRQAVMIALLLTLAVPCYAAPKTWQYWTWLAPDSSFAVGGFRRWATEKLPMVMPEKPPGFEGLKLVELMIQEPGEWLQFSVSLRHVPRVVFTKGSKIVITDVKGRRIDSEALIFCRDEDQTQIYDTRKQDVVVTLHSVWSRVSDSTARGTAKFRIGSVESKGGVEVKNVAAIAVIGAIAAPVKPQTEGR